MPASSTSRRPQSQTPTSAFASTLAPASASVAFSRLASGPTSAAVVLILLIWGRAGRVAARLGSSSGSSPLQTFYDRVPIWSAAIGAWLQHPVFWTRRQQFRTLGRSLTLAPATADRLLAAGITASFAAFLADSLFDVAYYDYKILLLFWLLAGIAASLPRLFSTNPA